MKYGVWPETRLQRIPMDATELHLVRPVSFKKVRELCEKRGIQKISCSSSCFARLKPKTKKWLEQKGIPVEIQHKAGRPLKIPLPKMLEIIEMVKDHRTYREIERTSQVPKSTAHYLAKYAQRGKIRQNGATVFLQ